MGSVGLGKFVILGIKLTLLGYSLVKFFLLGEHVTRFRHGFKESLLLGQSVLIGSVIGDNLLK